MLASCILPTYNRRAFLPKAIECFLRQDYAIRELIIVDDGSDCIRDLVPADPRIHYIRLDSRHTIGAKRNIACRRANGDVILHWDDDDWHADWRVSYQMSELRKTNASICGLDHLFYYEPSSNRAWEYTYPKNNKRWIAGNTLCYLKSFWQQHPFAEINIGEDTRFIWQAPADQILTLEKNNFLVATIHDANVSPKVTRGSYWTSQPAQRVHAMMDTTHRPRALVAAALGIGDILRVTPLVRVLHKLGYTVDLLLRPDYPPVCDLLRSCPEVRQIIVHPNHPDTNYEVAIFSAWSTTEATSVQATRKLCFDRTEWLRYGDTYCIAKIASALGWPEDLPAPFATHSGRQFNLQPGTVALHPGCKPDWPWKKWHGFDELARLLPNAVIIGTESDLNNNRTYFSREFRWPAHAQNYVGKLSLPDTAALLSQCSALVSNDSGMMHLGVALGIQTLGIFGITNPEREATRASNMTVVTKVLACEPECRKKPYGRRDCERHLECLKTLTAQEVLDRLPQSIAPRKEPVVNPPLTLTYHGHVFDASGYGQAARAYIHALHESGVELSVRDLSTHERQVQDPLIESLVGKTVREDFHLFHGIPSLWARDAFRLPNAIGMTVWETDSMPTQWRNTLNHVLEVWLPCDFNVSTFQPQLSRPVFKLPHATLPPAETSPPSGVRLSAALEDFVFYSIFEWQDRKHPLGQLTAYFRAFPEDGPHLLIFKTNPGAKQEAQSALAEARRATGSKARAEIYTEAWTAPEIDSLHRRGDCYVSLHRGEGWCYPLFEAACRGTPVVATAYSGPLEYLNPQSHQLVSYSLTSVRQRYAFYHPRMRWAEPDLGEAARRLRWVYENKEEAREKSAAAAIPLQHRHAPETIGEIAKTRLLQLLERNNQPRWQQHQAAVRKSPVRPPQPIPGNWYDADYFEHGVKSNWNGGYQWRNFQGLFQDTAAFLATLFPHASSFVDAGCAKGFLVKALRALGKDAWGFDSSPWAIQHAVEGAEPFLQSASAESIQFNRHFDFTLAFDLLSHLTEEQAMEFLTHARDWTTTGLLAVIPLSQAPDGRDLSHISLHGREWWHQLFLRAGWRQDALHAALENACQRHALPARVGWDIFLYSPR
jgi:ADP-heptose:LPS heptosyltransferase